MGSWRCWRVEGMSVYASLAGLQAPGHCSVILCKRSLLHPQLPLTTPSWSICPLLHSVQVAA